MRITMSRALREKCIVTVNIAVLHAAGTDYSFVGGHTIISSP